MSNIPFGPSTLQRIGKTVLLKSLNRSDYQRWTNPSSLEAWWETRTQKIAALIPRGTRVIEFGAGRRWLESYLDPSCSYLPSDLVDRGPGTIICDLNQRPLPNLRHVQPDVAVFAGVLEYIRNLESVIDWLSGQVSICIASYAYTQLSSNPLQNIRARLSRAYYGYMNSYTEEDLIGLFSRHGFLCTSKDTWTTQRIFVFANQRVGHSSCASGS